MESINLDNNFETTPTALHFAPSKVFSSIINYAILTPSVCCQNKRPSL